MRLAWHTIRTGRMSTETTFKDGVAVITGAGSGIGEGIARHAAAIGMRVVLADIAVDRAEKVAGAIRAAGGQAIAVRTDVTDPVALDELAERAYAKFGDVTLLVNNAGIETLGFVWELSVERWEQTLRVNIHGIIHGVRAFAPRMLSSPRETYIANISSLAGLGMMPVQTPYMLSKHAVLSFSECLYLEMQLQPKPVNVSVVLPGPVATRIFEDANGVDAEPAVASHREIMRRMLVDQGMPPLDAGRIILDGIAAKQFWVSTHPDATATIARRRAEHLAGLTDPTMSAEMRSTMKG
jgi:NAD(P)-dependent dehydrogenase (short-subunit alcohol dehydrogenase family)